VWADVPTRVTWRALRALYRHARKGSALYQLARRDKLGEAAAWSTEAHLLAEAIDELRVLRYLYVAAHRQRDTPAPPRPQLVPRPGAAAPLPAAAPEGEGRTHIGYGAIPAADFETWWTTGEEDAA
jgi:hypothetical protein